jgi:hypothetical protein
MLLNITKKYDRNFSIKPMLPVTFQIISYEPLDDVLNAKQATMMAKVSIASLSLLCLLLTSHQ